MLITHDLGVVARMADQVAVMYAGEILETGSADDVFYRSAHPYTLGLRAAPAWTIQIVNRRHFPLGNGFVFALARAGTFAAPPTILIVRMMMAAVAAIALMLMSAFDIQIAVPRSAG